MTSYERIKDMSEDELEAHQRDAEMELLKLNAQVATGTPPENPGKIGELRRTIAKIKTAQHD
jgi:large subunit ribosomal protein L29